MIDLKVIQNKLVKNLETVLDEVKHAEVSELLKVFQIKTSEVHSKESIQQISAQLPTKGNHIYWFEVGKPALLAKIFKNRADKISYKCARENKNDDSHYVYVGICTTTKLTDRFKQHCGWGNDHTYSLQLHKWLGDTELLFTFTYIEIKSAIIVQYLEDQLHEDLKPLFGKPGLNNKIKAVRE